MIPYQRTSRSSAAGAKRAGTSAKRNQPPPPPPTDGTTAGVTPEQWGKWEQHKSYYSLEVVQNPMRARMCGFGDKDRRPLAPAAVAKMVVRRRDDSIVDIDEIDIAFFVVMVDLWSMDGQEEMNLVLHPSSAGHLAASNHVKRRPRPPPPAHEPLPGPEPPHSMQFNGNPTPHFPARPVGEPPTNVMPSPQPYQQQYSFPQTQPGVDQAAYPSVYGPDPSSWQFPPHSGSADRPGPNPSSTPSAPQYHGSSLPSIHSFGENPPGSAIPPGYATQPFPGPEPTPPQTLDPQLRETPVTSTPTYSAPSSYDHQYLNPQFISPNSSFAGEGPNYARTLVGPLIANACRLLDENRQPGIFFLFQDLSIRTEGKFRLRLRLVNVGAAPAPDRGAKSVHADVSPVLAQAFSQPFEVFSAKKFPGVPETTPLSVAFSSQGQKLPLRNRHGPGKVRTKKGRRRGSSDSGASEDDESGSDS